MTEIKKGGKRVGAGRKPINDKKIPITIYLNKSLVEDFGRAKLVSIMLGSIGEILTSRDENKTQESSKSQKTVNSAKKQEEPIKTSKNEKPERMAGESSIDYAIRISEWGKTLNK